MLWASRARPAIEEQSREGIIEGNAVIVGTTLGNIEGVSLNTTEGVFEGTTEGLTEGMRLGVLLGLPLSSND